MLVVLVPCCALVRASVGGVKYKAIVFLSSSSSVCLKFLVSLLLSSVMMSLSSSVPRVQEVLGVEKRILVDVVCLTDTVGVVAVKKNRWLSVGSVARTV